MWIPPQSTSKKSLEVNQYVGDKSLKKRAYVKIEEWEPHKDFVLRQRHAKVKEKDILHALRYERGFMVEMHQLKKVLQLWNSKRNLKRRQRDYIVQIVKERRRAGKNQTIFYHPSGTLIDLPEVKEIMRRYGNSEPLEPPSPGGLIPGSPRIRQTPPDILFDAREISPIYSDPYSLGHSNDTTSPESLTSMQSPTIVTGAEYASATVSHMEIDRFLEQTTAQSYPNVTVPTTLGYSSNISPGALYPPLGFGDDLSTSSMYSNRPILHPEVDPALEYRLPKPARPSIPPSSMTTGFFPGSSSSGFISGPPAPPVPPTRYSPVNESYSYPPPAPAPPRRPSPQRYAPPAPPPQIQSTAPAPPPVQTMSQSKSKGSFFSFPRFGFSSKKSSQPSMASGGSMVQPGPAPYVQPGASADQESAFFPPPQPMLPPSQPPFPIAAPGFAAGPPAPPSLSDARQNWNEDEQEPLRKASGRSAARRTQRKEPYIKDEFAEISTLDYSREKAKEGRTAEDSKALLEMANRAGRLLSGMSPNEDELSKRSRRRAEEDAMRRAEEEELIRRKTEEARIERQRMEEYRIFAQEQARIQALEQARIQEEEARHRELQRAYTRPEAMELDEDAEWSEEEPKQANWRQSSGDTWKQEPVDDDAWPEEEEEDSWQDPATSQQSVDVEHQRLKETFQRVSGRYNFYQPIMRIQKEITVGNKHVIFAQVEPKSGLKFKTYDDGDTFKIKLTEIKNEDDDDLVNALEGFTISDKDKKEKDDSKDPVGASKELEGSDNKKDGKEKWDDEKEEEKWSDDEEKEEKWEEDDEKEDEWGEEEERGDKWGDKEAENVLTKLDNLSLTGTPAAAPEKPASSTEVPATKAVATDKPVTRSKNYIPFKKLLSIELEYDEFHDVEFASEDMEYIYRIHLRDWLKKKVEDAEWELGMRPRKLKKSNGKVFSEETDLEKLPKHIYQATKHLVKADMDPEATKAEIQYETKLWNWVLQRHKKIISYMKETSSPYWTTTWKKTDQAVAYFLPFLGKRFGTKHWFTLEGIKILGESFIWEEIEGGWKDSLRLRNLAYDGFMNLGMENTEMVSKCVDDGVVEKEGGKGRRKMELRRAVEHYRLTREAVGDWSQLGVYAIGKLIRALAKVDKERAKILIPIAAGGLLEIPRGFWWRMEIANSIGMVGEAMREVGMVKEATVFLWEMMPGMRKIENIQESLPAARVLGGLAAGFEVLGRPVTAMEWRVRVVEVTSKALGNSHPETILWAKRARRGVEARGVQFSTVPKLRTAEWIAGRVFWEGQRHGVDQKKLLKFTRRVIRKFESSSR
ncbi:hypothetical protein TWF281_003282 [Arthrobotrys megalospora]